MNYTGCRAFTDAECEKILENMEGRYWARDRALFELMRRTGFRISEVLSLRMQDVFDYGDGTVRNSMTVHKASMKGKKQSRSMPIHDMARKALALHINIANLHYDSFKTFPVFSRQGTNREMGRRHALRVIKAAAAKAGLDGERVGTHSMRKTFASAVYSAEGIKGDLAKMARLLGHHNPANTLRYIEFLDGSLADAVLGT